MNQPAPAPRRRPDEVSERHTFKATTTGEADKMTRLRTYNLGHYERMLLALAVGAALGDTAMAEGLDLGTRRTDLATLRHLFGGFGTTTIVTESDLD